MAKVDPMPDQETLDKRRETKWVIDPDDVAPSDEMRVRQWGWSIMKKYESKLDDKIPDKTIVYQKEIEPEEIDILNIYPFDGLHWFIMKVGKFWVLRLCYTKTTGGGVILAQMTYAQT